MINLNHIKIFCVCAYTLFDLFIFCCQQIKYRTYIFFFFFYVKTSIPTFSSSKVRVARMCGKAVIYKQNRARRDINICPCKRARCMHVALKYNTIFQFCRTVWRTGKRVRGTADSFFHHVSRDCSYNRSSSKATFVVAVTKILKFLLEIDRLPHIAVTFA